MTFGPWNQQTNTAGDFYFVSEFTKIFLEFGAKVRDPYGNFKELPTFEYVLKNDASVFAIAEGKVSGIAWQEDTNDYGFSVQSLNDPNFTVIYDHVLNLRIKLGDMIQPGDTLGTPGTWGTNGGRFEIMINNTQTKRSYCPFCYFNPEKTDIYQQQVGQLMQDWETFKSDTTIYDEKNHLLPGCRYESMLTY